MPETSHKVLPAVRERGTALLIVLLLVATLSVVTLGIVSHVAQSYRINLYGASRVQSLWYGVGVEDIATARLKQFLIATEGKLTRLTPGFGEPLTMPLNGGSLTGRMTDASNCFNLNSLGQTKDEAEADGSIDAALFYTRLLSALEFDAATAQALTESLQDWIDEDNSPRVNGAETYYYSTMPSPHASADLPLVTPMELLSIKGYSADVFRRIRPYVCVRPGREIGQFNINTLPAERAALLFPVFSGEVDSASIQVLLESLGSQPFEKVEDFLALPTFAIVGESQRLTDVLGIQSEYFQLSGEVVYLDNATRYEAVFGRTDTNGVKLIRRRLGADI